jgi:hypothetical protein
VAEVVAHEHGLIVAFNRSSQFAATPTALLQLVPQRVHLVVRTHDGAIYELMP